jgi:hypothetical protein
MSSSLLEPYPQHYKTAFSTQHSAIGPQHSKAEWVADDFLGTNLFHARAGKQNCAAKATAS